MMLKIYNSLSREKEAFVPMMPGKIGIYVCGITVYDRCHIGHGRSMVAFDVVVRYLRHRGYEVKFVRNITDIDDKIIKRAVELDMDINELTSLQIDAMHEDERALGILPPDVEPRATTHIDSILSLIKTLVDKGYAYQTESGDVCFRVNSFSDYGKLSHQDIDGLKSGVRIDVAEDKESPLDFVLWKKAKAHEPSWPSPYGDGRPGWHIECSAMALKELGDTFDIHGGGSDLQFPHHENEIAQSEAATGHPFARYWMHAGMLQVNHEKMSKSLGNFFTIEDVLNKHHHETVRYFLLSSHYRSILNYSDENLLNAHKALMRLYQSLKGIDIHTDAIDEAWMNRLYDVLDDDFNTPLALSVMFDLSHEVNRSKDGILANTLKQMGAILGLIQSNPEEFLQSGALDDEKEKIERLIAERLEAKAHKDWTRADAIRASLTNMGVELEDSPQGTTWRKI